MEVFTMITKVTSLRLDEKAKADAYSIFEEIGLKPTQAFNLFLKQVVLQRGIPFDVKIPNQQTIDAMRELKNGGGKTYKTSQDMYDDLDI